MTIKLSTIVNSTSGIDEIPQNVIDEIKEFHTMFVDGLIAKNEFDDMLFLRNITNDLTE